MVEGARLESVYTATYRGFESLPLRHIPAGFHSAARISAGGVSKANSIGQGGLRDVANLG